MTRNKKILIAVGIIATVGIGYLVYNQFMVKKSWAFRDNHWLANSPNKLGFIGATKPPFKVADKINIKQIAGATNPQYNGTTTVTSITKVGDEWVVAISKAYGKSTPAEGGIIASA